MDTTTRRAKLRTKTGCLTCRQRRKKCDERLPVCNGCSSSRRACRWPSRSDMTDRRFGKSRDDHHPEPSPPPRPPAAGRGLHDPSYPRDRDDGDDITLLAAVVRCQEGILAQRRSPRGLDGDAAPVGSFLALEAGIAQAAMSRGMEHAICRHFARRYYGLLVLPDCHPGFYDAWLGEILDLMVRNRSLYYSVLACAATHLHFIDATPQLQHLALTYYSNSISSLSRQIEVAATRVENHNGVLISVMLLYLHGCMGLGTYTDIPRHVVAATRILSMRLFSSRGAIGRLFDKVAVESVLYQIFLVTTGYWSDGIRLDYDFDAAFWDRAQALLEQSVFFPGQTTLDSPVLGVPAHLFRLVIDLREHFRSPPSDAALRDLAARVEPWEAFLLLREDAESSPGAAPAPDRDRLNRDSTYLYAAIASMLAERLAGGGGEGAADDLVRPVEPGRADCWQAEKALAVMRQHAGDLRWFECYIGIWPVYTLGYLVDSADGLRLVMADLRTRWDQTRLSIVARYINDLETARRLGDDDVVGHVHAPLVL